MSMMPRCPECGKDSLIGVSPWGQYYICAYCGYVPFGGKEMDETQRKIDELEKRIKELEDRPPAYWPVPYYLYWPMPPYPWSYQITCDNKTEA